MSAVLVIARISLIYSGFFLKSKAVSKKILIWLSHLVCMTILNVSLSNIIFLSSDFFTDKFPNCTTIGIKSSTSKPNSFMFWPCFSTICFKPYPLLVFGSFLPHTISINPISSRNSALGHSPFCTLSKCLIASFVSNAPLRGVLAQCFGAHDTRTAAEITVLYPCLLMLNPLWG